MTSTSLQAQRPAARLGLAAVALSLALALPLGPSRAAEPPDSADKISPLLIGATVPSIELRDVDGKPVDVAALAKEKRSILIFYRGGW